MTTIEPRPQTLAEQVDGVVAYLAAELAQASKDGDIGAVAEGHEDVTTVLSRLRTLAGDYETVLLDLLATIEDQTLVVGGVEYAREPKFTGWKWDKKAVYRKVLAGYIGEDHPELGNAAAALAKCAGNPLTGTKDDEGLKGEHIAYTAHRDRSQTGWKLETKRVTP